MSRLLACISVALLAWLALPCGAHAHPLVERARTLYEEASFTDALTATREAEAATDLRRADLVALLETRALVEHALGDAQARDATLRALSAITPSHTFGPDAPPELQSRLEELARAEATLRVTARARFDGARVVVTCETHGTPAELVRRVRVSTRSDDDAPFVASDATFTPAARAAELALPRPEEGTLAYFVDLVGPGGVVLTSAGTASEPLELRDGRALGTGAGGEARSSGGLGAPFWIGLGIGVAAVLTTVLVLVATSGDPETQPTSPMYVGF